jgi:hypothetical protein
VLAQRADHRLCSALCNEAGNQVPHCRINVVRGVANQDRKVARVHRGSIAELSGGVVWHGRTEDVARLVGAVGRHCRCAGGVVAGPGTPPCAAHQLLGDQHTLDHLAFARSVRSRLIAEEQRCAPSKQTDWAAFLVACHAATAPIPRASGRVAMVVLALLLLAAVRGPGPGFATAAPDQQIASWYTR